VFDAILTLEQKRLRDEVRAFVKGVPRQLILDMDADRVRYPREFVEELAQRHLLGLRFPTEYGGRGLGWADEIVALEEVGVLGTSLACLFSLPSIVGEALHVFGTPEQKDRWLRPVLAGRLTVAEALTEPRGGSDFFGTTTLARREGEEFVLEGQKRFVVGAEGADLFLVYARTLCLPGTPQRKRYSAGQADPQARPHEGLSAFIVERGPGVQVEHVYGLMGTRGGRHGAYLFPRSAGAGRQPPRPGKRRGGDILPDDDPGTDDQRGWGVGHGPRRAGGGCPLFGSAQGVRPKDPQL